MRASDIYRRRPFAALAGAPAVADSRPLAARIARTITPQLLDEIARAHRAGRRLLVMTTNLDAARGVVWDIGAIAASGDPARLKLVRDVLLASASIPGVFPPVMIEAEGAGHRFREMHVDGATTAGAFGLPPALLWGELPTLPIERGGSMTVLYNGSVRPGYTVVPPRVLPIAARALDTLLAVADQTTLSAYRAFAHEHGVAFEIHALPPDVQPTPSNAFNPDCMRALYALGEHLAQAQAPARAVDTRACSASAPAPSIRVEDPTAGDPPSPRHS